MSGWNSHGYLVQETPLSQYTSGGVLGQYKLLRVEAEMSDDEAYLVPITPENDAEYDIRSVGTEFCTENNLPNSVAYINQEFQLLGIACLRHDGTKCTSDVVFFINRLYDLLALYRKAAALKDDLETRNHRLICETDHQQSIALRAKRLQEQTSRELDQEREKTRQISLKYSQVCNKLKSEKEEVKRLTAVLQSRDLQHKHEHKKKEREVHRLKERLHQLLADKVPDRKVGMDLLNIASRRSEEGRRATWKTGPEKQEEEMYQVLISNYEERHRELMQENGELRDCLLSLQRELSALLKRTGDLSVTSVLDISNHSDLLVPSDDNEHSIKSRLSITDLGEGYFQMPYDIVRHEIERTFKETCDQISESMKKSLIRYVAKHHSSVTLSKSMGSNSSERDHMERRRSCDSSEVERLRKQVNNYKAIIQQQEELIQQSLSPHSKSSEKSFHQESQLLREKENLSEQKKFFLEEKTNFEKERRTFTEAAIHLSKERQQLQEERAKLIKQHFLNIRPFKENHQKKSKGDGHMSRFLPATPVFSPAKSSGTVLTSNLHGTTELYQALGLSSLSDQISEEASSAKSDRQGSINTSSTNGNYSSPQQLSLSVTNSTADAQSVGTSSSSVCSLPVDFLTSAEDTKVSHTSSTFQKFKSDDV